MRTPETFEMPSAAAPAGDAQGESTTTVLPTGVRWSRLPPELPRALARLCAERAEAEASIESHYAMRTSAATEAFRTETAQVESRFAAETEAAEQAYQKALRFAVKRFEAESSEADQFDRATRQAISARARSEREEAEARHESARWEAVTLFEAGERGERQRNEQAKKDLEAEVESLAELKAQTDLLLGSYRKYKAPAEPPAEAPELDADADPLDALRRSLNEADDALVAVAAMRLPRALAGPGVIWLFLLPVAGLGFLAAIWLPLVPGLIGALILGVAIGVALRAWFYAAARRGLAAHVPQLVGALGRAEALVPRTRAWATQEHRRLLAENQVKRDREFAGADAELAQRRDESDSARATSLAELDAKTAQRIAAAERERDSRRDAASEARRARLDELQTWHSRETRRIADERDRRLTDAEERRRRDWQALIDRWRSGVAEIGAAAATVDAEAGRRFLDWDDPDARWSPPTEVPPALRFGALDLSLARIPHGIPRDERLRALAPEGFVLPALLTFPDRGSLLLRASGAGKDAGLSVLRGAMLRFLTSLPPGKVRFTILDPVGLGRNFSAFMHLADYLDLLVTGRIWTEPPQIEQRLADLSLHMETVIQQYLRNEFATLEDYNRQAGEVAEPYRVLVVAHFPANFHDQSAQRLASIATGGARCGIYTLILVDEDQPVPGTVKLEELEAHAETLVWHPEAGRFTWEHPDFAPFALMPDRPPAESAVTHLMHEVGESARRANRVEVPFEVIAPPADRWWAGDTRGGVEVPLGRAGATKLQSLSLGRGTAQHVLIAGRTGSGKSTLLHALITDSALIYGPDQLEFYLIDFKKGVEFKTYAEHALPHARVVAIESEREFGLSVLQRLDDELRRRGELFRAQGVQDLNGYRNAGGSAPLPRVLLIVDEFQEFFVEDDKLAQDAALLLDRLVRQGRAFGIHVILGSQTLGGAYSLARTTLGQMAVRIALQCSEADAHLILSEDNAAARLLSRPGEAIYNDANGLIEGNHIFQVVWLPEQRREHYLERVRELARAREPGVERPQIVFEGNVPSDLAKNTKLRDLIDAPAWPETPRVPQAWLGEAVAIKDPTAAVFRRQGGNHLLVIGQDADGARGVLAAALLSLAAQHAPGAARFALLDGTPEDDAEHDVLRRVAERSPHSIRVRGIRDGAAVLEELGTELALRQEGASGPPTYLFIYDVSRFRDLRKSDDDFGYGRRDEEARPTPAQVFSELVREGPSLGIHVIAWFDTLNNVQRVLDRGALREFEMRVLFQMSANDSSTLIDSPLANRLGPHRALFSSEDQGRLEKFRPYRVPSEDWMARAIARWRARPAVADGPLPRDEGSTASLVPGERA
jgi:S-DNA-T family DNA segregation ATPase FtsK/SpoIIIE